MKKQFQFIKKLEEELMDAGMSTGEIEDIKVKSTRKAQNSSISESYVSKSMSINKNSKE